MPESKRILKVRVARDCDKGLQIFVQSNLDWSIFGISDKNSKPTFILGGIKCFLPKENRLPNVPGCFRTDNVWEWDDSPNLSLLLAQDIQSGVTFDFGLEPISDDKIAAFIANLKTQAKILYFSYLKPVGVEVSVSMEIVEKTLTTQC